jgi:UDP-N-acetylglucosamine 2-epimerase (hydrolysing)
MRKIVFITGTRADFGKLKPLIRAVEQHGDFEYSIFATGMHLLYRYGMTVEEIHKAGFTNIFAYMNQIHGEPMEMVLANTITGLSRYLHEYEPDLLVVHGDRVEAMAGATVGALRNILVGHVEGGELSGTVDDLIRHSVTKLAATRRAVGVHTHHRLSGY